MTDETNTHQTSPENSAEISDTPDSEEKTSGSRHGCAWGCAATLIILPLIYMASIGPTYAMLLKFNMPIWTHKACGTIYHPLFMLMRHNQTFDLYISEYISWWLRLFHY